MGEIVLYGLKKYESVIDRVIKELDYEDNYFNMKLVLTEALSNAFNHGNNSDITKPIYLRYYSNDNCIRIEIEDSGIDKGMITNTKRDTECDELNESGRGLFLIRCFSDDIQFKNNTLIIYIDRNNDGKRKGDIV